MFGDDYGFARATLEAAAAPPAVHPALIATAIVPTAIAVPAATCRRQKSPERAVRAGQGRSGMALTMVDPSVGGNCPGRLPASVSMRSRPLEGANPRARRYFTLHAAFRTTAATPFVMG